MSKSLNLVLRISLVVSMQVVILGSLFGQQDILDHTIELKKTRYTPQEIIDELRSVHSISISYGQIPEKSEIQFESRTQTIREILDQTLENTSFHYQVVGAKILIIRKPDNDEKSDKATISGFIKDAETGEALIGATVFDKVSKSGVVANNYGFFSMTLLKDSVDLVISYLGFETESFQLKLQQDLSLNLEMKSSANLLNEVTVEAQSYESVELTPQMSTISLTAKQVENVPMILGEHDLLKAIQLLPGIQGGTEGSSGFYVRGGGPDHNLILLDGVPVYNTSHMFGFFSVFNTDAINHVEVIKGGFPARYGGRLSSVIDISMKEGSNKELSGKATVGLISSKFTVEGPIKNENTSFIVSGRRTYMDLLAIPFDINGRNNYYFYDFNTKVNHRISNNDRVFFSFYGGNDTFNFVTEDTFYDNIEGEKKLINESGLKWGNLVSVIRWNHIFNPRLFGAFSATVSKFRFDTSDERSLSDTPSTKSLEYASGITDYGFRSSFEYQIQPRYMVAFGGSVIYHQFKTGVIDLQSNDQVEKIGNTNVDAFEYSAYVENDFSIGNKLRINAGLHTSMFDVKSTQYFSVQPRLSGRLLLNNQFSIKTSYSEMRQFIHLLTNSGVGLPTDLWVPATDLIKPQFSRQAAIGGAKILGEYEITLEGYYKQMENLIEYENGASYLSTDTNWEDKVESGNGTSYGAEFLLQKNSGRLTGWIGYTLSKTTRQFDQLNFGRSFPYKYDRRHDLSLTSSYKLNKGWILSGNWVFGTGNYASIPLTKYFSSGSTRNTGLDPGLLYQLAWSIYSPQTLNFNERNNYRIRSYHRLDLSLSHSKEKKRGTRIWSFGVYNAYNRLNPFFVFIDTVDNPNPNPGWVRRVPALKQRTLFPAIPFVNYSFKF